MHSIRVKIIAITISAILASILSLGGIGLLMIGIRNDRTSVEKMNLISDKMQQRLNAYFGSIQQSVDMGIHMAEDSLDGMDIMLFSSSRSPEETARLDSILTQHCAEVEHAFTSIAHNTNGIVTYYYCINSDLGSAEHGFFWSKLNEEDFIKQPPLISSELDINDIEHTTWYYSPIKAGSPVWIGPYKAHFLGEVLTISYVAPIYRYGFLIGVLGMDILFETITEQISPLTVYDSGYIFLMDKDGRILYHPSVESGTMISKLVGDIDPELYRRSSSGDDLIRYTLNGQERQISFTTLRNKIKLAVTAPVSEINGSQGKVTLIMAGVGAALVGIFTMVTLIIVNAMTKPLLNLASAAQRLMDGDYDAELNYDGNDEVGTLTRSFRQMRDHLKLYISDLNSRAYTDAMTGVKNKGTFGIYAGRINDEIRRLGPENAPEFAIVIFDCNYLKHINDEHGHERGDIYLKTACNLICRVFAHSPVFRLGGDEFGTILQKEDYQQRDALLADFDRSAKEISDAAAQPWEQISVSHGMAAFQPGKDASVEEVMARADRKMYEDKKKYH